MLMGKSKVLVKCISVKSFHKKCQQNPRAVATDTGHWWSDNFRWNLWQCLV